jgi:diguanylate cyclase (GGDEF)-like protein
MLWPSLIAAFLPFALLWLPGARWRPALVIAAAALTLATAIMAVRAPWDRLPAWARAVPAFAYLLVYVLLRAGGGNSGVAPMVLLPVFWLGLYGTRRQLWCLLAGIAAIVFFPLLLQASYPPSVWRAGILLLAVSGIVGATIQSLVGYVRDHTRERNELLHRLDTLAHTDALTGLANRRAWETELERGLARARHNGEPVTVALVDIDSFKAINDRRGHSGGDSLLAEVADRWSRGLRPDDVLARVGGDEFALLIPSCTEAEAADVVARLRRQMPVPYSCSAGVATWNRTESADRLMIRADEALYDAKRRRAAADAGGDPQNWRSRLAAEPVNH